MKTKKEERAAPLRPQRPEYKKHDTQNQNCWCKPEVIKGIGDDGDLVIHRDVERKLH